MGAANLATDRDVHECQNVDRFREKCNGHSDLRTSMWSITPLNRALVAAGAVA